MGAGACRQIGRHPAEDALVILTEWKEFRSPDFGEIKRRLAQPLIFDGRNLYDPRDMIRHGIEYFPIGRKA